MSRIKKERENHVNPVNPARPVAPGDGTGVEKVPPQAAKFYSSSLCALIVRLKTLCPLCLCGEKVPPQAAKF